MAPENEDTLRLGRLEDKFKLYEPILLSLQGLTTIPAEINKIHKDIRVLTDSRISVREQLVTLFKTQSKGYDEVVKKLEEKTKAQEKEVEDCPIKDVVSRLGVAEKDIAVVKLFKGRIITMEGALDSFKLKGWDLIFRIAPWVIAGCGVLWGVLKS